MDFVFTVRRIEGGEFGAEPGVSRFLEVPKETKSVEVAHENKKKSEWVKKVLAQAVSSTNPRTGNPTGDIVIYVHGFNTTQTTMLERHRKIRKGLEAVGFQGAVLSFDWPSDDQTLNYLEDRWDAKLTAYQLVKEGIVRFVKHQKEDCEINVHILAHSMGCYVVREAFDHADDMPHVAANSWSASQVILLSADVSSGSLREGNPKCSSLYRHCVRLTNFFNPFDDALKLSDIKRIGVSPRAGRIGLPRRHPQKAVNVDCGDYFKANKTRFEKLKNAGHTWYFDDQKLLKDVYQTIMGDIDRHSIPGRVAGTDGSLKLA